MKLFPQSLFLAFFILFTEIAGAQEKALKIFLADSSMLHASVSMCIIDADSGNNIYELNSEKSLAPASVMKLITSGIAIEMLGPDFRFTTTMGYQGTFDNQTGKLNGDIIIKGGGDPALGSKYFPEQYGNFTGTWVSEIKKLGIKKIEGRIIADDSYFDYQPVPSKWPWEDIGNYYGAGVYGLMAYDNTVLLHFSSGANGTPARLIRTEPEGYRYNFKNMLTSEGDSDEGYVFAAPYSSSGWIAGTIPSDSKDFELKASISDPPLFLAEQLKRLLDSEGIMSSGDPASCRTIGQKEDEQLNVISTISSPSLASIIEVLNHESINLFAETCLKQLGKSYGKDGSAADGVKVEMDFLSKAGIRRDGLFIEDGSGLSPRNAVTSHGFAEFLFYMKNHTSHFSEFYSSLPEAGKEGTLKFCFRDPIFNSRLRAKSGSMERVRCYAGYFTALSGRKMIFAFLVNNFSGSSQPIISGIEKVIGETISNN